MESPELQQEEEHSCRREQGWIRTGWESGIGLWEPNLRSGTVQLEDGSLTCSSDWYVLKLSSEYPPELGAKKKILMKKISLYKSASCLRLHLGLTHGSVFFELWNES